MEKSRKFAYKFAIDEVPPSVNHIYGKTFRSGKPVFYKEQSVRDFEQLTGYRLKRLKQPLDGDLALEVIFTFKDPKAYARRDLDNCLKVLIDSLTSTGIIKDDKLFTKITCEKQLGAANASAGHISTKKP